eukprot:4440911-Prymnesium_polylepis.1
MSKPERSSEAQVEQRYDPKRCGRLARVCESRGEIARRNFCAKAAKAAKGAAQTTHDAVS